MRPSWHARPASLVSTAARTVARSDFSEAQQLLQVLMEDGLLFFLSQAFQTQYPGDRPVNRHVGGPVGTKDHAVDADCIDQKAQGGLALGQTIVIELPE